MGILAASAYNRIAVIMPAYNASAFISRAVESILSQSYGNLELYIVDDGSTDDTAALVRGFSERDSRVHLLSTANGGPARARNLALKEIRGKFDYIAFSDADDEYLPEAFEFLLSAAAGGAEIVFGGFTILNPDGSENHYFEPAGEYTRVQLKDEFTSLYKANLLNQVWGKLFKATLVEDSAVTFPDYRWGEDRLFIYSCLENVSRVSVVPYCGYIYKMYNSSSLISGFSSQKPAVCIESDRRVRRLCEVFGVEDEGYCRYMFLKSIFSCFANMFSPACSLSRTEKRDYIDSVLSNAYVAERCRNVSGGPEARLISKAVCSGNVSLNMFLARTAALLSRAVPQLFQRIKHKK